MKCLLPTAIACAGLLATAGAAEIGRPGDWAEPQGNLTVTWVGTPAGQVLRLRTPGSSFLYTRDGRLPAQLDEFDTLSFQAHREASSEPTVVEVQFLEADGKAKFWRKIELTHTGSKQIEVPLRFLRWSDTRTPRWDRIRRFGLYFRNAGTLSVDRIALTRGQHRARLTAGDLAGIAFPDADRAALKIVDQPDLLLLSNAPELDTTILAGRLNEVGRRIRRDLPFLGEPSGQPTLIVFATADAYRDFTPRFAQCLGGVATPPSSGGYTVQAIATSSWDERQGTLRPVYSHEYVHTWLDRAAGLPSGVGDWIQEGFANHYQLCFHPQADFAAIVLAGIADPQQHLPLRQLCSGKRIPMNRYWQALTVVRFLLEKSPHRERLPALFEAFRSAASTDLAPHIGTILETDWDTFTRDWLEFCRDTYPKP